MKLMGGLFVLSGSKCQEACCVLNCLILSMTKNEWLKTALDIIFFSDLQKQFVSVFVM